MDPRCTLREKLKGHPELRWTEADDFIRIEPLRPDGFTVALGPQGDEWVVYLGEGGFHQAFESADEALNFVAWCFSGECRLREVRRGTRVQKCIVEAKDDGDWQTVLTTGFFLFAPWHRRVEAVFQNPNLLKA